MWHITDVCDGPFMDLESGPMAPFMGSAAVGDRVVDHSATNVDVKYTRAQLEAVVDESGLTGLREIGTQVGVKAGSINDLIDRILEVAGEAE